MNLRGRVVPVIDLAVKPGLPPTRVSRVDVRPHRRGQSSTARTPASASLIDGVGDVLTLSEDEIEHTPAFGAQVRVDQLLGMAKVGQEARAAAQHRPHPLAGGAPGLDDARPPPRRGSKEAAPHLSPSTHHACAYRSRPEALPRIRRHGRPRPRTGGHGLQEVLELDEARSWDQHTPHEVMLTTSEIMKSLLDTETGERGFIITGVEAVPWSRLPGSGRDRFEAKPEPCPGAHQGQPAPADAPREDRQAPRRVALLRAGADHPAPPQRGRGEDAGGSRRRGGQEGARKDPHWTRCARRSRRSTTRRSSSSASGRRRRTRSSQDDVRDVADRRSARDHRRRRARRRLQQDDPLAAHPGGVDPPAHRRGRLHGPRHGEEPDEFGQMLGAVKAMSERLGGLHRRSP